MDYFCLGSFPPAPCSPPLGGSDGSSAVRFTPAVKYGGREKWPSGRDTRCMSGHPCRAHHKLKWARKGQSVLEVLYELLPRSKSSNEISTQILVVSQAPQDQPALDRDWQQPLNHPPRVKQSSCASNGLRNEFASHNIAAQYDPNAHVKERSRWNKLPKKNAHKRSQLITERPRPAKAIAWSKQGSKATISTAVP